MITVQTPVASRTVTRRTLCEQVVELMRSDILAGRLVPGDRIREGDTALRYGVSPTPLREALRQLEAEGLVEVYAQAGARVAGLSERELRQIYDLRLTLEPDALRQAIQHGDTAWEERLRAAWHQLREVVAVGNVSGEVLSWSEAHDELQDALFAACPSEWLMRFVRILYTQTQRYRLVAVLEKDAEPVPPGGGWVAEHDAICEAALNRDPARAVSALKRHLKSTVLTVERAFPAMDAGRAK